jgi:hypothetical protein
LDYLSTTRKSRKVMDNGKLKCSVTWAGKAAGNAGYTHHCVKDRGHKEELHTCWCFSEYIEKDSKEGAYRE